MTQRTQTLLALVAFLLGIVTFMAAYWYLGTVAATTQLPAPNQPIPAGALITPAMLTVREAPRALLNEPIYTQAADLVGKVAQVPLAAGQAVYRQHAVTLRDYRLVDDPSLVVVSVPVEPARTVGGQVQPGQRVDLWTLPLIRQRDEETIITATLILSDVLVVDVRASQGQATTRQPQAMPDTLSAQATATPQAQQQTVPLQILTVALPLTETARLLDAVATTENGAATFWVALAPVVRPVVVTPPVTVAQRSTPVTPPAPTPSPAPAATPGAPANPQWRVSHTGGTLRVRETPRGNVLGTLTEGAVVYQLEGPQLVDNTPWYRVTQLAPALTGWVAGTYLEAVP